MKVFYLSILIFLPTSVFAIEFKRCVDSNGIEYFTNVSIDNLGNDCQQPSIYDVQLNQDYERLNETLISLQVQPEILEPETTNIEDSDNDLEEVLNPDKALEQLLENSRQAPPNIPTEIFHSRSDAVGTILENQ